MIVYLYRVGRNLNRAYRTCEAFGIRRMDLYECDAKLSGSLFGAAGRVSVEEVNSWPAWDRAVALETSYKMPLREVVWKRVDVLVIGGETSGLPVSKIHAAQRAKICLPGNISGLTVEAALAIALYARHEALYGS